MYTREFLGLKEAQVISEAILEVAFKDPDFPIAVAIVDALGELIFFSKMDNAHPQNVNLALKKAYTSARTRKNTDQIYTHYQNIKADWFTSVRDMGDPNFTPFPGGICIKGKDGKIIGAIGISGRADHRPQPSEPYLAEIGLKALAAFMG
jgi:uncharacterized protein GlcG (DUF336 family)